MTAPASRQVPTPQVQLIYFTGCPNVDAARAAVRAALDAAGVATHVEEVDVGRPDAPAWAQGWGSPTILVDGRDVTGAGRAGAAACRLYRGGAPEVASIRRALERRRPPGIALTSLGALVAAAAASACCVVPVVLAMVGVSGAGAGAILAPYRPWFLGATALALAWAFWSSYQRRRSCDCRTDPSQRRGRVALWLTSVVAVALAAYPMVVDGDAGAGDPHAGAKAALTLSIEGMDCPACTKGLVRRLAAVPGVISATVDYHTGDAVVRHDGRPGVAAAALAAVAAAGYRGRLGVP